MSNWIVRPSFAARKDFDSILSWTKANFGSIQANKYATLLEDAIAVLTQGPVVRGAKSHDDLLSGLCSIKMRKGRHVVFFRVDEKHERTLVVLRILHDTMDFARHLPEEK